MSQTDWKLRGASTNEYIVRPKIVRDIHTQSEWATVWGKLNEMRSVGIIEIERGDKKFKIRSNSNDSPVWEQTFGNETGEARFTYEDPLVSGRTFGPTHDLETGDFPQYRHDVIYVTQNDSNTIPLLDDESQRRAHEIMSYGELLPHTKRQLTAWREKMVEIDGFSAIFNGASESLLNTDKGGLGIKLPGCSAAGEPRVPYNTYVVGQSGLTNPNYTNATHEATLGALLKALTNSKAYAFDYNEHKKMVYLIEQLRFAPTRVAGRQYKAVCLADPRNLARLMALDGTLVGVEKYLSSGEGTKSRILDGTKTIELDDILYIANNYIPYFRPTATASKVTHLPVGTNPFESSFSNDSDICPNVYLGAGGVLRGTRRDVWFTGSGKGFSDAGHKKTTTVAMHYFDAWKRKGWTTKDGTNSILDDACLVGYWYDPGRGVAYAG